ncbi:MAG: type II toxin-antitoxin system VapC family toxin [Nocardioidaceae bacterium]
MSTFADSSALVKLYADEAGHDDVRALTTVVVSQLARVEVPSALWRKHRLGELTPADTSVLVADFESDYFGTPSSPAQFVAVAVTNGVLDQAARLCAVHGLRAHDAVQLASAIAAAAADPECRTFAAYDSHLCAAASTEGLTVLGR